MDACYDSAEIANGRQPHHHHRHHHQQQEVDPLGNAASRPVTAFRLPSFFLFHHHHHHHLSAVAVAACRLRLIVVVVVVVVVSRKTEPNDKKRIQKPTRTFRVVVAAGS